MKFIPFLITTVLVISVASVGLGVVDLNNLREDPIEELSQLGSNVERLLSSIDIGEEDRLETSNGDHGQESSPKEDTSDLKDPDTDNKTRPWEQVDCNIDPLPDPPGYVDIAPGWNFMDYEINPDNPYESYTLIHDAGKIFALGSHGGTLRLDDGLWTRLDSNTSETLNGMMLGTWPSYIVGDYGVLRTYDPVTGLIKNFETPFDDMDKYDRPHLYEAFGTSHNNFWILGDGVFYHYHKLSPSHPDYDASDTSPKWEYLNPPVSPASLRGPYDPYIRDVWVHNHNSVYILVANPGAQQTLRKWNGVNWSEGIELPTNNLIRKIWGLGPNDIFAVGVAGTVLHYDGVNWSEYNNDGLDHFNSYSDIWGTSHSNLYAAGDGVSSYTQLKHFDGEYWSSLDIPTDESLTSIVGWSDALHSVYITGNEGAILHYVELITGEDENLQWIGGKKDQYSFINDIDTYDDELYIAGGYSTQTLADYNLFVVNENCDLESTSLDVDGYWVAIEVSNSNIYILGWAEKDTLFVSRSNLDGSNREYFYDDFSDVNASLSKIAVDSQGFIYVGGSIEGTLDGQTSSGVKGEKNKLKHAFDAFIIKYSPDGQRLWSKVFGAPVDDFNVISIGETVDNLLIDDDNNLLVGGLTYATTGFNISTSEKTYEVSSEHLGDNSLDQRSMYIVKLDPDGTPTAAKILGTSSHEYFRCLAAYDNGYYLLGDTNYNGIIEGQTGNGERNILVSKLDDSLETVWTRLLSYPGTQYGNDLAVDKDESIYITGFTKDSVGGHRYVGDSDVFIMKLTGDGGIQGAKLLGGTSGDVGRYVYIKPNGKPTVLATSYSVEIAGYTENAIGFLWCDIDILTDPYAECRLAYR